MSISGLIKKFKNRDRLEKKDLAGELAMFAIFALILYLFYKSWVVMPLMLPFMWFYGGYARKQARQRTRRRLGIQFKDFLVSLSAAVRAGYSIENAIKEGAREAEVLYGPDEIICREARILINQIGLGMTAEQAFDEMARRNRVEDIVTFAEVFKIAERSGGDMVEVIKKTSEDIAQKVDTLQEIQVLISSKKLEQNIMSLMPLAIILYIDLTGDGLLDPLYGTVLGVVIMTVCLGLYIFAYFLAGKIMEIRI